MDSKIKKLENNLKAEIEKINNTLKSISKHDVEKDINFKNEIEKIIKDKFEQNKETPDNDIKNIKDDLYKIRGDINVLFHNQVTVNIPHQPTVQPTVQQFYQQYHSQMGHNPC